MAVIDTSMDMPKCCEECPYCNGENATCDKGVLIPWRAFDVENYRNTNCPLKSTDELIAEIEKFAELGDVGFTRNLIPKDTVLDIIYKYCDKEKTSGNDN